MISRAARIHGVHSRQRAGVCRAAWKAGGIGAGGDSAFRPREARWRTGNGQRFKGFRAKRELFFEASGRSGGVLVCWRVSRGTPSALPRPNPPQTSSLHSEARGPRVKSSRFVGISANSGPLSHYLFPCPGGLQGPSGQTHPKSPPQTTHPTQSHCARLFGGPGCVSQLRRNKLQPGGPG